MKKLTVIISAYNCEKNIEKCIYSILKQTYRNIQIIIIDDNSKDKTFELCKKINTKEKRIEVYKNDKNLGVSISRNIGILHAKGDFITFVDADDYIESNMYKNLIKVFEENDNIDISMSNFYMEYLGKDIRKNGKKQYILNREKLLDKVFLTNYFCGFVWNKIYKTEIIKNNKILFDDNIHICEDLLFNCKYFNYVREAYYTERKFYHYIQNKNSSYNSKKYNNRWITVIDAYEQIKCCVNNTSKLNFKYSYLLAILNLKEKLYSNNIKDKNLIKKINVIIKENKKNFFSNKDINIIIKLKVFIKIYFLKIFIIMKN